MNKKKINNPFRDLTKFEWGLWLVSVAVVLASFLINDLYGFISWRRMEKRQQKQ